jgi:hypothetical protein
MMAVVVFLRSKEVRKYGAGAQEEGEAIEGKHK